MRLKAPGGVIFRFTPGPDRIEKLCTPSPHDYIQTITLDEKRGLIYGQTFPVFKLIVYHVGTGEVDDLDFLGSITHVSAIDDDGCFWGTWDWRHHHLFKYNPDARQMTYFHHGTPNAEKESGIMYQGAGPVDVMINGGDGFLYVGTTAGGLCRLNPKTAEVEYLGHPGPSQRLPGLKVWHDSLLLGAGGDDNAGFLFTYDRDTGTIRRLGAIADSKTGLKLFRVHDLALSLDGRTAYVAETDIMDRSGYLWECELEL
jgi:sugar lactone lactonase YvrE